MFDRLRRSRRSAPSGTGRFAVPPPAVKPLWRRLLTWGVVVAVVLVAAGYLFTSGIPDMRCGGMFDDLTLVEGECVGATDGSYVFDPMFQDVQEDIKAENDRVAKRHADEGVPAVKIAMLSTLTPTDSSPLSREQILSAIEGAYVALHRANETPGLGDQQPLIQLILVNEGSVQQGWSTAVDLIEDMTGDEIPLAIVMGQAISTERTTSAANRLSGLGIPMVTATATADGLDFAHIPGLIRTSPSNTDFATAIRHHLDAQDVLKRGILVFDSSKEDTYTSTMREAFEAQLGDYIQFSNQRFPGQSVEQGGPKVFATITQNICTAAPDMVFFVGRPPDFDAFLEMLSERVCRDKPLTVLRAGLYPRNVGPELLDTGNLTLVHATSYDPGWAAGAPAPEGFADFLGFYQQLIARDPEALDDGGAVNNHDALAVAVTAVRITNPWDSAPPKPADVLENLLLLNSQNTVRGATGTLSYSDNRGGNPGGKYVPIIITPAPDGTDRADPYITPTE